MTKKPLLDTIVGSVGYLEAGLKIEKEENAYLRKHITNLEKALEEIAKYCKEKSKTEWAHSCYTARIVSIAKQALPKKGIKND